MRIDFYEEKSFTLIELLIVIGILSVVAVVAIWVINPTELLKRSRDSNRLSDLRTLNTALGIVSVQGGTYFGSSSVVYVSIPDSSSTCGNLGLPALPSGWSYNCKPNSSYRNVDSTGWIPVNFTSLAIAAPLSVLPIDPINTTSSGLYFTYVAGGSWELTTLTESTKYASLAASDGGVDPAMYEVGNDVLLAPFTHGLVGYWKLDEGSGSNAYDSSGYGNNGTFGSPAPTWASGKINNALSFDGAGANVNATLNSITLNQYTVSFWVYESQINSGSGMLTLRLAGTSFYVVWAGAFRVVDNALQITTAGGYAGSSNTNDYLNKWTLMTFTRDSTQTVNIYKNGIFQVSAPSSGGSATNPVLNIGNILPNGRDLIGLIDDVHIYNRALSAAEISAIYNATK